MKYLDKDRCSAPVSAGANIFRWLGLSCLPRKVVQFGDKEAGDITILGRQIIRDSDVTKTRRHYHTDPRALRQHIGPHERAAIDPPALVRPRAHITAESGEQLRLSAALFDSRGPSKLQESAEWRHDAGVREKVIAVPPSATETMAGAVHQSLSGNSRVVHRLSVTGGYWRSEIFTHRPDIHSSVVSTTASQPDRPLHNTHAITAPSEMAAVEMMAAMWRAEGMSDRVMEQGRALHAIVPAEQHARALAVPSEEKRRHHNGPSHAANQKQNQKTEMNADHNKRQLELETHSGTTRKPSDRSAATVASASQKDGRAPVVGSARPEFKGGMTRGNDATPSDTADLGRNSGSRSGWGAVMFIQRLQKYAV